MRPDRPKAPARGLCGSTRACHRPSNRKKNMEIIGHGQLRHRFWGDYSAAIVIQFDSPSSAERAIPHLSPKGFLPQWQSAENYVRIEVDNDQLDQLTSHLGSLGADTTKITSLARSVDYGEPWTICFQDVYVDPRQLQLV